MDIDTVRNWLTDNQLKLNDKTLCLELKPSPIHFSYNVGDFPLRVERFFRDLGVIIDADLKFDLHVHHVVVSSFRLINLLFRIFSLDSVNLYLKFYAAYVIPAILYCSPLYSESSVRNMNAIESIQKYFTRRLYSRVHPQTADT